VQRRGWVTLVSRFHPVCPAVVSVETAGSPRFLGNPPCASALLLDPVRTPNARPVAAFARGPGWSNDPGS